MKKQILVVMAMAMMSAISLSAQAQTASPAELIANIPFEFQVGEETMPAGTYRVIYLNPVSDRRVLRIRGVDGQRTVIVGTSNVLGKLQDEARLVFHRYGNEYYFAQAWFAADGTGLAARKTKRERAKEQLAGERRKIETVSLRREKN